MINIILNLLNGSMLFCSVVNINFGFVFVKFVEDMLVEVVMFICGLVLEWCVGIVVDVDKYMLKVL